MQNEKKEHYLFLVLMPDGRRLALYETMNGKTYVNDNGRRIAGYTETTRDGIIFVPSGEENEGS